MKDESGEFRPKLKMQDFSKDTLVRLWQAASRCYVGIDGIWTALMRERFGDKLAFELDTEVWRRNTPMELRRVREAANIQGDDVAAVFKAWQCGPASAGIMETEYDLKNRNHGILTVRQCRSLDYFERHGEEALQKFVCEVVDMQEIAVYAHIFNPKINVTALKLPPRGSKEEIACQWEFKMELGP